MTFNVRHPSCVLFALTCTYEPGYPGDLESPPDPPEIEVIEAEWLPAEEAVNPELVESLFESCWDLIVEAADASR